MDVFSINLNPLPIDFYVIRTIVVIKLYKKNYLKETLNSCYNSEKSKQKFTAW